MALLAHTLALLAMAVAIAANEVKPLDKAQDSFDDQYRGCGTDMTESLPALNRSEFQQNPLFAEAWAKAADVWQRQGPPVSPLPSAQAIAVMAYMMNGRLHSMFNDAVRVAGRSPQEYRDNFHYKTLHFLLTDALVTLRDKQKGKCWEVLRQDCGVWLEAKQGDTIRFGKFMPIFEKQSTGSCPVETFFQVYTCHGVDISSFFDQPRGSAVVLIPPFETFEVTTVVQERDKSQIKLRSTGAFSKYNCEWLRGGSIPRTPFHLGGFFLATTVLAVATGNL